MKNQYVIGLPQQDYIRIIGQDAYSVICSDEKGFVKLRQEMFEGKKVKLYKLVEVKR